MTDAKDHTAIWKTAFGRLKPWTQAIDKLPSDEVLFKRALIEVRTVTYGQALEPKVTRSIASDIAHYIRKEFDPAKRRPNPKSSRAQRTGRNKAILTAALAAQVSGAPKSTRQLAVEFGLTASQISRILQQSGNPRGSRSQPGIDNILVVALQLLAEIQPRDGQCVVKKDFLINNLELSLPLGSTCSGHDLIDRIEQAKRGWWFTLAGDVVVISKGRRLNQEVAVALASRRSVRHDQPNRVLQSFGRKVWADLFAALTVIQERASPGDWRAFLAATLISSGDFDAFSRSSIEKAELIPFQKLVCDDMEALVTRIAKALRLRKDRDVLDTIRVWNREYSPHAPVMSSVLDIVGLTRATDWANALHIWMSLSCYGDRIRMRLLHGRDISDIDVFMQALEDTDGDTTEMIEMLKSAALR